MDIKKIVQIQEDIEKMCESHYFKEKGINIFCVLDSEFSVDSDIIFYVNVDQDNYIHTFALTQYTIKGFLGGLFYFAQSAESKHVNLYKLVSYGHN